MRTRQRNGCAYDDYYYNSSYAGVVGAGELLDVRAAAALLARNPETVRRWIWSGRLPARRDGSKLLVARADLDALPGASPRTALALAHWAGLAAEHRRNPDVIRTAAGSAAELVLSARRPSPRTGGRARAGR